MYQVTLNTAPEDREALTKAGFIRVDGLPVFRERIDPINGIVRETAYIIGQEKQAHRYKPGWQQHGFHVCLAPRGGEIWLRARYEGSGLCVRSLSAQLGIKWQMTLRVPCSGANERLDWSMLLKRHADPDWQFCPPKRSKSTTRQPHEA